MDFWASLEHKIYYKYRGEVPANLRSELTQAADAAAQLDEKMEALHRLVDRTGQTRPDPVESLDVESLDLSVLYANFMLGPRRGPGVCEVCFNFTDGYWRCYACTHNDLHLDAGIALRWSSLDALGILGPAGGSPVSAPEDGRTPLNACPC